MVENAMYFANSDIYNIIRSLGGQWNDSKERPILCLIKSTENEQLYWAIPVGMYNHRDTKAIERLERFLNYSTRDIRSCFYHVGNTNTKSIFFISDTIPIIDKYINREYYGYNNNIYVVKNPKLISELRRKLARILSFENSKPNYFRQHITDVKKYLINEASE